MNFDKIQVRQCKMITDPAQKSSPAGVLAPGSLLAASPSVYIVVARPAPSIATHLGLLYLLLKVHGRHLKWHDLLWRESAIHGRGAHLHGDAVLSRGHESIVSRGHGHPRECHWRGGKHAWHAVHGVHCPWHSQARGEGRHGGTPRAHHRIWHPLHHLQTRITHSTPSCCMLTYNACSFSFLSVLNMPLQTTW